MSTSPPPLLTFAQLDQESGAAAPPMTTPDQEYPLEAWYRAVRNTPIKDLAIEDLCRACRQRIHLDYVLPLALQALEEDPIAGSMYEGELIASLVPVPIDYWRHHPAHAATLRMVIEGARREGVVDLENDLNELGRRLAAGGG